MDVWLQTVMEERCADGRGWAVMTGGGGGWDSPALVDILAQYAVMGGAQGF